MKLFEAKYAHTHIHTLDGSTEMATGTMIQYESISQMSRSLYCTRHHYHRGDVDATATSAAAAAAIVATAAAVSCLLHCEIYYLDKYSNIVKLFPYLVSVFVAVVVFHKIETKNSVCGGMSVCLFLFKFFFSARNFHSR